MATEAATSHVADTRTMDQKQLMAKYRYEASEHRRILMSRGSGLDPLWREFRRFLADMGPAPDTDHIVTRVIAGTLTYAPGKCAWIRRDNQPKPLPPTEAPAGPTFGVWTSIDGKPIEYGGLARQLGVTTESMTGAMRSGQTPESLVERAAITQSLSNSAASDIGWMPQEKEKREAFLMAYRMWHMQVGSRFATSATPAFLYIYSALPGMIETRDELIGLDLWDPPTERGRQLRSQHNLWRRFCESMMKVESARTDFAIYKQYSLTHQLDDLWARVQQAEARFRAKTPASAVPTAAAGPGGPQVALSPAA